MIKLTPFWQGFELKKNIVAELLLVFVAISWGGTFLPVAEAIKSINVFSFLFWRFLLAVILMYILTIKVIKFDKISILCGLFLGFWLFGGFTLQTYALKFTYSSTVAFITGLNVVVVPFSMLIFFKQSVNKFAFAGAFIAIIGLYFLSGNEGLGFGLGESLAIICAICYALHIAFTGVLVQKCNIYAMVVSQFFAVAFLCFLGAVFFGEDNAKSVLGGLEFSLEADFLIAIVVCAVFATVFAYFVQTYAQVYTTPTKTALILTLEPVSAGIIGYFFGGEVLSMAQICGAVAILLGVLFSELGSNLVKNSSIKLD